MFPINGLVDEVLWGYIQAILWAESDDNDDPLEKNYTFESFAPESMAAMRKDCSRFLAQNAADIGDRLEEAGSDLWLTRNEHGSGFWDGDWEDAGQRLTDASKKCGLRYAYLAGGKIHVEGATG